MITNERQYKITKAEADRFRRALSEFDSSSQENGDIHPRLIRAQRDGLQSQLDDLLDELAEYDRLKDGSVSAIEIESFSDLAEGLIKARIASGLSQKGLADRLNLKEQQIQRYEAERYSSASYQRLQQVAHAIGIKIRKEILLPQEAINAEGLLTKLRQAGIGRQFIFNQLLDERDEENLSLDDDGLVLAKLSDTVSRVYGWSADQLHGAPPLSLPKYAGAEARFKMPARRNQSLVNTYVAYAHYLAVLVLEACKDLPVRQIPTDPKTLRMEIIEAYGGLDLRSALRFVWDCGVPVLPLTGPGTFHGASWRYDGRNVIVLKQTSAHEERWLHDLIHEVDHAGSEPHKLNHEILELDETSAERRESQEEIDAGQFAGDVVLNGEAENLAQRCVAAAKGSVERLKSVVPTIAKKNGVTVGALANYLAFRLSWQGINWWGTAANLQRGSADPWEITRDVFLERFPFSRISGIDRKLIERALKQG